MLEDVLYDMLPIVGFATILSAVFVLAVLWKAKGNLRILTYFAVSDIVNGIAFVICGIYGNYVTIAGTGNDLIHPSSCLTCAPHVLVWALTDTTEVLCMLIFLVDRIVQILAPTSYGKISKGYVSLKFGLILFGSGLLGLIPAFYETLTAPSAVEISRLCRFEQVVLPTFYETHLLFIVWAPLLGMLWIFLVFVVYLVRRSKPRWSYNWSEGIVETKQMIALCFIRCLFTATAVKLILFNVKLASNAKEVELLRDLLLRAALACLVSVLSPGIYMLISTEFSERQATLFHPYDKTAKRTWQSANDPPAESHEIKAELGSWYSTTGNIRGEAGVPMRGEKELCSSFY